VVAEPIDYYLGMSGVPYDRELDLDMDFKWAEPAEPQFPARREGSVAPCFHWEPPPFTCQRKLPGRRRAFLLGLASVADILGRSKLWDETGVYRFRYLKPNDANAMAIYSDWCAIGGDMHRATENFERTELERVDI
jgi:hypothetical protein